MRLKIDQRSSEWLELRKTKIGASDIPIIMGTSPFKNVARLVDEKRNGNSGYTSKAMQNGVDREMGVLELVKNEINMEIDRSPVFVHDTNTYAMASLDGLTVDGLTIIEVKAPQESNHNNHKQNGIPVYYNQQMQWQMYVSGVKKGIFASWYDNDLYLEEVDYDKELVEIMIKAADQFYSKYIVGSESVSEIKSSVFISDEVWLKEQMAYLDLQEKKKPHLEALKALEEEEESIKSFISDLAKEENIVGSRLKVTIFERKGSIDEDKLSKNGINVNQFRKRPTMCRKITTI